MKKPGVKTVLKSVSLILLFGLLSCETEENIKFHLNSIDSSTYYSDEIIPDDYKMIYGKWKLYDVSGGFSGGGHDPHYDYLEIKSIGIFGIIKGGSLLEYGKIEFLNDNDDTIDFLPVKLISQYNSAGSSYMHPPEKYVNLRGRDSLNLISPCCDMYNYHYTRVK